MLFFIHIPKAAGTSLRVALENKLQDRLVKIYDDQPGRTTTDALSRQLPADSVIYGHFGFRLHQAFDAAPRYATVFRHPVSRVVSWYNFQAQDPNMPFNSDTREASLIELLRQESNEQLSNHMTKMIAGRDVRNIADRETLAIAKANLETFEFVSTQENLHEDIPRLSNLLGIEISALEHINKSEARTTERECAEEIIKYNQLDLELYEHALELRR